MSREEDRVLTIHFNDKTKLSLAFPPQADSPALSTKLEGFLRQERLVVEADGTVLLFPLSSIKYLQVTPAPRVLPASVVQGARIVS